MKKKKKDKHTKCVNCGRDKICPNEGRRIDGTWYSDALLIPVYEGKWVCCIKCYKQLVEAST